MWFSGKAFVDRAYLRFGLSVVVVVAAFGLRQSLVWYLGAELPPFLTFYPAVIIAAIVGGLWPGVTATALSSLLADYWILAPRRTFEIADRADFVGLLIFFSMGVLLSVVAEHSRRDRRRIAIYETEHALQLTRDAIREKDDLLRDVGVMAKIGGWDIDLQTGESSWTAEVARIHDLDPSVRPTKESGIAYYHGNSRTRIEAAVQAAIDDGTPYDLELEILSAKGIHKWIRTTCQPVVENGKTIRLRGSLQDITERKEAEESRQKSEALFSKVFHASPIGINIFRVADGRSIDVNGAYLEMVGYSRNEVIDRTAEELNLFVDSDARDARVEEIRKTGRMENQEIKIRRKSGEIRDVLASIHVIDFGGDPIGLVVGFDVTERKKATAALRASEAQLRSIVENAPYGIYRTVDAEGGRFIFVNPAMVRMLGYDSVEEALALNLEKEVYRAAEDRATAISMMRSAGGDSANLELHWRKKDGKELTISSSGKVVRMDDGRECFESIAEDVTERRLLERQLRQAQKMEAIGRLAGGVAHDFNNLLGVITGYSEVAENHLSSGHVVSGYLNQIKTAAMRGANLTRQLLMFSRQQVVFPKVIDLNAVVSNTMNMLGRTIGEDVNLSFTPGEHLGSIKADVGQIEQILMNLAVNARDAMPDGGNLAIETRNEELDESYRMQHEPVIPGPYVLLSMADTGFGMDEITRSKIFDPFFTTKEPGKGTGLGLSIVYGIVKQSGGYIWVYSEPGRGTTFKIYFPFTPESAEMLKEVVEPEVVGGTETILLAEDDEDLRDLTLELLKGVGYRVLEADSPGHALEIAQEEQRPIHLLLTDVIMPGMSGPELASRLKTLRPDLKIVFMSGYTGNRLDKRTPDADDPVLLEKPFSRGSLLATVHKVLEGQD